MTKKSHRKRAGKPAAKTVVAPEPAPVQAQTILKQPEPGPEPVSAGISPRLLAAVCLLLAGLNFATFWPARSHEFLFYDDPEFITENAQIQSGLNWTTVRYAFTKILVGNWHPVTVLSHALDCQLFGVNPSAHHLVSVTLHAINAVLLFLLIRAMTGAVWRGALVAALFSLHPLRVESVAWIAERKDLLCGAFFLLTALAYASYAKRQRDLDWNAPFAQRWRTGLRFYIGSLLFFALGLMSKPMLVTLPFVLLLLDYWPLCRFKEPLARHSFPLLLEKIPFLILSAAMSFLTFLAQEHAGATDIVRNVSVPERLANAFTSYVRYLGKEIWPANLAIIYPHPARHYYLSDQWPGWEIVAAFLLVVLVSWLAVLQARRRPYFAVGWFWFLGTLVPVIGLVQAGEQSMADRYTYLPSIGLLLALVWWVGDVVEERFHIPQWKIPAFAAVALVPVLVGLTRHQLQFWHNSLTLFSHAVDVTADNPSAQFGVGMGLLEEGLPSRAMVRFRVALAIDPTYGRAHYTMAQLLRMQGNLQASANEYQAALRLNPADVRALVNLAGVLPLLGQYERASELLKQALKVDPQSTEAMNNLAWLLATCPDPALRNGARAVELSERACRLSDFRQPALIGTLGAAYAESSRFREAIDAATRAAALAIKSGDTNLAQRNQKLIGLYQSGKPYHEPHALRIQHR
ncbi:MAG TPA: tetratricopeptide repeat protein [Verrucomicrobiae bacterium]|nr:tetratricopeptide repeat protein [Verrucomicrobiae bacterium]